MQWESGRKWMAEGGDHRHAAPDVSPCLLTCLPDLAREWGQRNKGKKRTPFQTLPSHSLASSLRYLLLNSSFCSCQAGDRRPIPASAVAGGAMQGIPSAIFYLPSFTSPSDPEPGEGRGKRSGVKDGASGAVRLDPVPGSKAGPDWGDYRLRPFLVRTSSSETMWRGSIFVVESS
jgi:hypothetical protein